MKNRRLLNIIPLIIVFLFVQCSSQKLMFKSGTEKDIIGEWHVTSLDLSGIDDMVEKLSVDLGVTGIELENLKKETRANLEKDLRNEVITFKSNHKVHMSDGVDADWKYYRHNKKIVITTEDDSYTDFIIDKLDGDYLKAHFVGYEKDNKYVIGMEFKRK